MGLVVGLVVEGEGGSGSGRGGVGLLVEGEGGSGSGRGGVGLLVEGGLSGSSKATAYG